MKDMLYAIPDDQITCPPVSVGFGLLQGLVTTLLIRQVTETLTYTNQGMIDICYVLTNLQLADVLMKVLSPIMTVRVLPPTLDDQLRPNMELSVIQRSLP